MLLHGNPVLLSFLITSFGTTPVPKICNSIISQLFLFLLSVGNSSPQTSPMENQWMLQSKCWGQLPKACCQSQRNQTKIFFTFITVTWSAQSNSGDQHHLYSFKRSKQTCPRHHKDWTASVIHHLNTGNKPKTVQATQMPKPLLCNCRSIYRQSATVGCRSQLWSTRLNPFTALLIKETMWLRAACVKNTQDIHYQDIIGFLLMTDKKARVHKEKLNIF